MQLFLTGAGRIIGKGFWGKRDKISVSPPYIKYIYIRVYICICIYTYIFDQLSGNKFCYRYNQLVEISFYWTCCRSSSRLEQNCRLETTETLHSRNGAKSYSSILQHSLHDTSWCSINPETAGLWATQRSGILLGRRVRRPRVCRPSLA